MDELAKFYEAVDAAHERYEAGDVTPSGLEVIAELGWQDYLSLKKQSAGFLKKQSAGFLKKQPDSGRELLCLPMERLFNQTVALLPEVSLVPPVSAHVNFHIPAESKSSCIILIDGIFRRELSNLSALGNSLVIAELANSYLEDGNSSRKRKETELFAAMNAAFTRGGVMIDVPTGTVIEQEIFILHMTSMKDEGDVSMVCPRISIRLAAGAEAKIYSKYVGGGCFTNMVTEVQLSPSAKLQYGYLQADSGFHFAHHRAEVASSASLSIMQAMAGGQLAGSVMDVWLADESAEFKISSVAAMADCKQADSMVRLHHLAGGDEQFFRNMAVATASLPMSIGTTLQSSGGKAEFNPAAKLPFAGCLSGNFTAAVEESLAKEWG